MAHFAQVINNIVTNIIVAEQEFIDTLPDKNYWIQTSYNSRGGIHYLTGTDQPSGLPHLRYNYAGIGFTYNQEIDAFIPPQPHNSWILNPKTCLWDPPIPYPNNEKLYFWDEKILNWVEINLEEYNG